MKCIYIEQTGGCEVLRYGDRPGPEPDQGEVLVKLAVSGVNFSDINQRSGGNKIPLPAVLGSEGAGTVERAGGGVTGFKPGDRVAYAMVRGSYAEYAAVPAKMLVPIPDGIDFPNAAAAMLQGMTAHYLSHSTFPLKSGHTALIHAGAGGTGGLLVQMAAMLGARVIATVGTQAKADLARQAGGDAILYTEQDWVAEVKRLTAGAGVDVVYDSVGQATFLKGLDCLKPRGMMVHFGVSSGQIEPFDTRGLTLTRGSLFLTRPTLASHIASPAELAWRSGDVFRWILEDKLPLRIDREYPLAQAAQAHQDLEDRKTTGKLLLRIAAL